MAVRTSADEDDGLAAEINVTPLVDVMLVLLIVFMVTAPMLSVGIPVSLPKTVVQEEAGEPDMVLTIQRDQTIWLGKEPVHIALLPERLKALAASHRGLQFRADEGLPYGFAAQVLGIVKSSGISEVGLITEKETGRRR